MSESDYARVIAADINKYRHSLGALVGIAQGLVCDHQLNDQEIHFLHDWLQQNQTASSTWPISILLGKVKGVLDDGKIDDDERKYLLRTLMKFIGSDGADLPKPAHATRLAHNNAVKVIFQKKNFCLTGEFVFGTRSLCEAEIEKRGGRCSSRVTTALNYVVIGSLGSAEWKHGSFGTKVEQAKKYQQRGLSIHVIDENAWSAALIADDTARAK